ncbi:MAG: hypothetical protein WCI71_10570 [Bacteroidota bacterium]
MFKTRIFSEMSQGVPLILLSFFISSLQGCMFYYKVQTINTVTSQDMKKYDSLNKYFILHQKDSAWHISKLKITDNALSGDLSLLPENRWKFLTTKPKGGNRYIKNKKPYESYVIEEIHLYISDSVVQKQLECGNIQLALPAIKYAEIYKKAKGRTTSSWLIPALGMPVIAGGLAAIIIGISVNSHGAGGADFVMTGK